MPQKTKPPRPKGQGVHLRGALLSLSNPFLYCAQIILLALLLQTPLYPNNTPSNLIDLEESTQDFILEVKQIHIPGYPHAFNPSIVRWKGLILMSFRIIPDLKDTYASQLGLIWLDENCCPISEPQLLDTKLSLTTPSRTDDGRLITLGEELYLVYSDNTQPKVSRGGFRVYVAKLQFDGDFHLCAPVCLSQFEGENPNKREKNWVPFIYEDRLLLAYSLTPHLIFYPHLDPNNLKNWEFGKEAPQNFRPERVTIAERQGTSEDGNSEDCGDTRRSGEPSQCKAGEAPLRHELALTQPKTNFSSCLGIDQGICDTVAHSLSNHLWKWGILRGGTTGLKVDDQYLSFFHSSIDIPTVHSGGKTISHYFMGAYTFSPTPPFAITQISPEPIIGKGFYNGPIYTPYWKPVRCVYPGGFVFDETFIWIAYGRQDHETWLMKLDKKKLLDSLVPTTVLP